MPDPDSARVVLEPLPRTNRLARVAGALLALLGLFVLLPNPADSSFWLFGGAPLVLGVLVATRGASMSVTLDGEVATVRGLVGARSIARADVLEITGFPALAWSGPGGKRKWTPMTCLRTSAGAPDWLVEHNAAALAQVERWVAG